MDNNINSNEISPISTSSDQNLFQGLSFWQETVLMRNITPFKPETNLTPFKSPQNCLQLIPRLFSSTPQQLTSNNLNPRLLTPRSIKPPQLTPNFNSAIKCSPSQIKTPIISQQKERTPVAKTPIPPKRAVRVIKRLLYEDLPNYYLINFEQKFPNNRICTSQQWIQKHKTKPYIIKLIDEFEQKLLENKKLASDLTEYEVKSILDRTLNDDIYLVKWIGWKQPTWEKRHYLIPKYESLLSEFDILNNQPLPIGGNGIIINDSKRVKEAIRVISKLDRGNSGHPNSYLLEWTSNSFRIYNEGKENIQTWEDKITLGNVKAIEEFECNLKRGIKSAKEAVQFEVECIEKRRCNKSKEIEYMVKWKGCDRRNWINREELLKCCQNLVKQYEIDRLKNGKRARN